jgi:2-polyprenyl-3-methyl-5-hydroxy-6-metoxy-1,4-benzoquinol methylase
MNVSVDQYEYAYTNSNEGHHHAYLLPPLLALLKQQTSPGIPKPRVLDLGCGNGSLSKQIALQGYEVIGVEDSASGVEVARKTIPECQFIYASIYDLPFAELEHSFDVVLAAEVIEHLLYPKELLKAAKRCLKPGGQLILTTP